MTQVLTEIINILVGGITGIATGVGQGVTSLVQSIFLTGAGTTENPYALSVFGGIVIVFAGIALAVRTFAVGLCGFCHIPWCKTLTYWGFYPFNASIG